ncbi:unnamed protein product [Rhodiola kirilowii]
MRVRVRVTMVIDGYEDDFSIFSGIRSCDLVVEAEEKQEPRKLVSCKGNMTRPEYERVERQD